MKKERMENTEREREREREQGIERKRTGNREREREQVTKEENPRTEGYTNPNSRFVFPGINFINWNEKKYCKKKV